MTQIHISIRKPKTGGLAPVTGVMRFRPVRRHFDAAKNLVIAASFDAYLSETGELTVDLLPTTGAFVWQVVELADTPQAYTRYVEVPDSRTKVEYADLVEVDAATFVPKALTGSTLLQVMHAASQAEAETLSAANPGKLIIFDETASTAKAAAVLASLESIASEASTNASVAAASLASVQHAALNATLLNTQIEDAAHKAKSSASNAQSSSAAASVKAVEVSDTVDAVKAKAGEVSAAVEDVKARSGDVLARIDSAAAEIEQHVQSVQSDAWNVTDKVQEVTEKGAAAIAAIDSAVQAVKDKAESASSELPSTGTTDIGTTEDTTGEPTAKKATVKGA